MDNVKKAGRVAKLQGDLLLIDRQVTACKEKHGVDIYNILAKISRMTSQDQDDNDGNDNLPVPGLQAAFQAATEDLVDLNHKRNQLEEELEIRQEAADKNKGGGAAVSAFFTSTKLKTELAYYEREIKVRQGIFGHQVFDDLQLMTQNNGQPFDENAHAAALVLNAARQEMQDILQRKQEKEAEIETAKATET